MKRYSWLHTIAIAGVAGWVVAASGAADAQERVRWKLASSYTSNLDVLGQNIIRVLDNIATMTDGNFEIQFNEPGALVPALEVFDAISKGSVQASYTSTGFHAGRVPHLIFFSSVPFGPNVNEYVAWIQHGGGYELYEQGLRRAQHQGLPVRHRGRRILRLVPPADREHRRSQGPEDAFLRVGRQGDGQARRLDPADRRRRHLSGPGARRDRRHRVLLSVARQDRSASTRSPSTTTFRAGISRRRSSS